MTYNEPTRWHFETAANAGTLAGPAIRRGAAGSRALGTWVQFDLQVVSDRLQAARFLAFGCPHVIAVADWIAQYAVGLPAVPTLPESVATLKARFAVPTEKMGRLLVIEDAWIAALAPPS
jgi:NifU-like protein involved in Fe-S cluster formation